MAASSSNLGFLLRLRRQMNNKAAKKTATAHPRIIPTMATMLILLALRACVHVMNGTNRKENNIAYFLFPGLPLPLEVVVELEVVVGLIAPGVFSVAGVALALFRQALSAPYTTV